MKKKPQWRIDLEAEAERQPPGERASFIRGVVWHRSYTARVNGRKGGAARAKKLTAKRRREIAKNAVAAREEKRTNS